MFASLIYWSRAIDIDVAVLLGTTISAINLFSLREFINDEVSKIKKALMNQSPKIDDDITRIKLNEAVNQIDRLKKGRIVKDKQVVSLMRYYELLKELKNVGRK